MDLILSIHYNIDFNRPVTPIKSSSVYGHYRIVVISLLKYRLLIVWLTLLLYLTTTVGNLISICITLEKSGSAPPII